MSNPDWQKFRDYCTGAVFREAKMDIATDLIEHANRRDKKVGGPSHLTDKMRKGAAEIKRMRAELGVLADDCEDAAVEAQGTIYHKIFLSVTARIRQSIKEEKWKISA